MEDQSFASSSSSSSSSKYTRSTSKEENRRRIGEDDLSIKVIKTYIQSDQKIDLDRRKLGWIDFEGGGKPKRWAGDFCDSYGLFTFDLSLLLWRDEKVRNEQAFSTVS